MMKSTSSISAAPVSPRPVATWKTSSGMPHSRSPSAISSDVSGVTSDGLRIDRVAGGQRRDAVAEGVGQRVVPRADHADHAERRDSATISLRPLTNSVGGLDLLVGEVLGRHLGPEAEGVGGVGDLGELGVLVGLAGLGDDRVDHPLGCCPSATSARGSSTRAAALEAERLPAGLRRAGARDDLLDLLGADGRGRCAMTSPVAGFSTGMPPSPFSTRWRWTVARRSPCAGLS